MVWRLKKEGLHPHYTAKGYHVGLRGRVAHFNVAITHIKRCYFMKSMKLKLIKTCSPISKKHNFKKHLVLAGFKKAISVYRQVEIMFLNQIDNSTFD